jgi:hypothetical protein
MGIVYFHDLPVYRLSEKAYYKRRDEEISAFVADAFSGLSFSPQQEQNLTLRMEQHYHDKYGPWLFNEIIGYVRLHFLGSQVRGEYFSVERDRLLRTRTKTMVYRTHKLAPEEDVPRDATNEQILKVILDYVDQCRKEKPRRYFDDTWLRTIGPMVDWNTVMKSGWDPRKHDDRADTVPSSSCRLG